MIGVHYHDLTDFTEWSYIFNTYQNGEANFCGDLALLMGTFWRCQFEGQIIVLECLFESQLLLDRREMQSLFNSFFLYKMARSIRK